jgi:D-alanine-D-alanine ligase
MSLKSALDSAQARESVLYVGFHGGMGEDGTVQKWMESRHLVFTGSGSEACRLAFDKMLGKKVVEGFGIRVAPAVVVSGRYMVEAEATLKEFLAKHGKMAVKPVADGSSVGLSIIDKEEDLKIALGHIQASPHMPFMAEAFISGTELTIGVIDDHNGPRPLPATEIRAQAGRLFDYNGKYLGEGVKEVTPAEVSDSVLRAAQRVALAAHSAFGCDGYSRTDIIVDKLGPVFLETNTLPGLTQASLIPQQLAVDGMSLHAFLELQIELAVDKAALHARSSSLPPLI